MMFSLIFTEIGMRFYLRFSKQSKMVSSQLVVIFEKVPQHDLNPYHYGLQLLKISLLCQV